MSLAMSPKRGRTVLVQLGYVSPKGAKDTKNIKNFLCSFASSREIFIELNHYRDAQSA
jgi:hypothetical protein